LLRLDFGLDIYANAEDHLQWRRELEEQGEMRSRETVLRNKNGERLVVLHSGAWCATAGCGLYYEGTIADITASHRQARQWSHEASHDSLTGLLNRRELERRLQLALENAAIDHSALAIVMIDLDGFKKVNDRFGHPAGDELLRHVSATLKRELRAGDLVGRSAAMNSLSCWSLFRAGRGARHGSDDGTAAQRAMPMVRSGAQAARKRRHCRRIGPGINPGSHSLSAPTLPATTPRRAAEIRFASIARTPPSMSK